MSKKFTELRFEEWIEKSLVANGYNYSFTHSNENEGRYDKDLCLVEEDCYVDEVFYEQLEYFADRLGNKTRGPSTLVRYD